MALHKHGNSEKNGMIGGNPRKRKPKPKPKKSDTKVAMVGGRDLTKKKKKPKARA